MNEKIKHIHYLYLLKGIGTEVFNKLIYILCKYYHAIVYMYNNHSLCVDAWVTIVISIASCYDCWMHVKP